jgi:hypothetical protein
MTDDWYESEQPTRRGLVAELQRIRRRTLIRPIPVLVLAVLVTGGIVRKISSRPVIVEAEVVLALAEGSMANRTASMPVDQLRAYVTQVLLPDNRLLELIDKYGMKSRLGTEFALEDMRGRFDVRIWKNSFVNYDEDDDNVRRSARIGISVRDIDPDRALDLAHDLAGLAMETAANLRQRRAEEITRQVAMMGAATGDEIRKLEQAISDKRTAVDEAYRRGQLDRAGILRIDLAALQNEKKRRDERLERITKSPEALAGRVAAAGLDMTLSVVDESRPERPTHSGLILIMVAAVVGTALLLGAFDSRVHEPDDVTRLGLPVLGHVPGFAGDNVGSMRTRSAAPSRVPSFQRWRFHR